MISLDYQDVSSRDDLRAARENVTNRALPVGGYPPNERQLVRSPYLSHAQPALNRKVDCFLHIQPR